MTVITNQRDLNRILAGIMCPEPPASERRAIHESGAWLWSAVCGLSAGHPHWEPADFCSDPAASYRLEGWLRERSMWLTMQNGHWRKEAMWKAEILIEPVFEGVTWHGEHASRLIALALAVCAAHGVELSLADGWDQK